MDISEGSVLSHLRIYRNDHGFVPGSAPSPTVAPPGTPEKLNILRARLEAGQQLHHPDDAQFHSPTATKEYSIRELAAAL